MNDVCYKKVLEAVKAGHQVMVFVHSRRDTVKTAKHIRDQAQKDENLAFFDMTKDPQYPLTERKVMKSVRPPADETRRGEVASSLFLVFSLASFFVCFLVCVVDLAILI
jgi:hypothetical protein